MLPPGWWRRSLSTAPCSRDAQTALQQDPCLTAVLQQPAMLGKMRWLVNNKENTCPWEVSRYSLSLGGRNNHTRASPLRCCELLERGSISYTSRISDSGVGEQRYVGLFVSTRVIWMKSEMPQRSLQKYFLPFYPVGPCYRSCFALSGWSRFTPFSHAIAN